MEHPDLAVQNSVFEYKQHQTDPLQDGGGNTGQVSFNQEAEGTGSGARLWHPKARPTDVLPPASLHHGKIL